MPGHESKWTDERLDDNIGIIHDELRALRELPRSVADLATQIEKVDDDLDRCFQLTRETSDELRAYIKGEQERREQERRERDNRNEQRRLERKSDRRWLVGTCFTAAGLVIAAIGLLAQ